MVRNAVLLAMLLLLTLSIHAYAQCPLPDVNQSFYVPQAGSVTAPAEGTLATRFFRMCPNNDGGSSLPNSARIKVVLKDMFGAPIVGLPAEQVYILFNGGTPAQGFFGQGADSIIANGVWNTSPLCPDVRELSADAPTDATGSTTITFGGSLPGSPGVYSRDPRRKWGHWDTDIPVMVGKMPCNPQRLKGKLTSASPLGTYELRLKNFDSVAGLGAVMNQGEIVTTVDYNTCVACMTVPTGFYCHWFDLDFSGTVNTVDLNIETAHYGHKCDFPMP